MVAFSASALVRTESLLVTLQTSGYAQDLQHGAIYLRDSIQRYYGDIEYDILVLAVTEGFDDLAWHRSEVQAYDLVDLPG